MTNINECDPVAGLGVAQAAVHLAQDEIPQGALRLCSLPSGGVILEEEELHHEPWPPELHPPEVVRVWGAGAYARPDREPCERVGPCAHPCRTRRACLVVPAPCVAGCTGPGRVGTPARGTGRI
jgi:hypothetical protein